MAARWKKITDNHWEFRQARCAIDVVRTSPRTWTAIHRRETRNEVVARGRKRSAVQRKAVTAACSRGQSWRRGHLVFSRPKRRR